MEDHSVNDQALRKGLSDHEASKSGGVPHWKSSCPDHLAVATRLKVENFKVEADVLSASLSKNRMNVRVALAAIAAVLGW